MAINLLPKDLLPTAGFLKTAALLRNIITLGFAIFIIGAAGTIGFFVFNSISIRNSNTKQEELKSSIKSQEQTEQGLVLVKDRLTKVSEIEAKESAGEEITNLTKVFSRVGQTGTLTEAVLEKDSLDTTFTVANSASLSQLLASVISAEDFKRVELMSFSFNPNVGYLVSLAFVTK